MGEKIGAVLMLIFLGGTLLVDLVAPAPAIKIMGEEKDALDKRLAGTFWEGKAAKRIEYQVESRSRLIHWLRPAINTAMIESFRSFPDDVLEGRDNWLFYKRNQVECSNVPRDRVLDRCVLVTAYVNILRGHDIEVVVVPIPDKSVVAPSFLKERQQKETVRAEEMYQLILSELNESGVHPINVRRILEQFPEDQRFHKTDTHWTAPGIHETAKAVAERLRSLLGSSDLGHPVKTRLRTRKPKHRVGGIARRLNLEKDSPLLDDYAADFPQLDVVIDQPSQGRPQPYRGSDQAPIILGGTSMSENKQFAPLIAHEFGQDIHDFSKQASGPTARLGTAIRQCLDGKRPWPRAAVWEFIQYHVSARSWHRWRHHAEDFFDAYVERDSLKTLDRDNTHIIRKHFKANEKDGVAVLSAERKNPFLLITHNSVSLPGDGTCALSLDLKSSSSGAAVMIFPDMKPFRSVVHSFAEGECRLTLPLIYRRAVGPFKLRFDVPEGTRITLNSLRLITTLRPVRHLRQDNVTLKRQETLKLDVPRDPGPRHYLVLRSRAVGVPTKVRIKAPGASTEELELTALKGEPLIVVLKLPAQGASLEVKVLEGEVTLNEMRLARL